MSERQAALLIASLIAAKEVGPPAEFEGRAKHSVLHPNFSMSFHGAPVTRDGKAASIRGKARGVQDIEDSMWLNIMSLVFYQALNAADISARFIVLQLAGWAGETDFATKFILPMIDVKLRGGKPLDHMPDFPSYFSSGTNAEL